MTRRRCSPRPNRSDRSRRSEQGCRFRGRSRIQAPGASRRKAGRWEVSAGAGGDMLVAGGFCYRRLTWPTGRCLGVAKIPRLLRVPPTSPSHRSPPARAGGTAGRWAIPAPGNPRTVHHPTAQSAITTKPPSARRAGSGQARAVSLDTRCRHPAFCSLVGNLASAILASLGFPTPARLARAHPSRTRIPRVRELEKGPGTPLRSEPVPFPIEAPRREPGGLRVVGPSLPPKPPPPERQNVRLSSAKTSRLS